MSELTYWQAARFLDCATFGPRQEDIVALQNSGVDNWLQHQLTIDANEHFPHLDAKQLTNGNVWPEQRNATWFDFALWGEDQLRQRVAYALSQILVVSNVGELMEKPDRPLATYYDLLVKYAFGNYRELLYHVSISPFMGEFLTHAGNKSRAVTGVDPDQNYAREVMQLFTLGLNKLNMWGEPILDGDGNPVPNFTEDDVENLAKLFTGWRRHTPLTHNINWRTPMYVDEINHDTTEKVVLGHIFPANVDAESELLALLDILVDHPSTAPNISKFLITKLVTSNPSSEYVYRVSTAFRNTGGELSAVIQAILTDEEVYRQDHYGARVRESRLHATAFLRALDCFTVRDIADGGLSLERTFPYLKVLGANSVFNFYDRDFIPPGPLGDRELLAPELDGGEWLDMVKVSNWMYEQIWIKAEDSRKSGRKHFIYVRLNPFFDIAKQEGEKALIDLIAMRFCKGQMTARLRRALEGIFAFHSSDGADLKQTVRQMIYFTSTSSEFRVQG
ncbi:DUF1800 family protein [Vibrio astriarenae]|uniref:DUF1800 family protein n=1 Tax=Vibrio astriarenae TaxID=1481923 RepID=A0A7Z2YFK8_9VIBR|nr:DUF1800 family protein [Vibrio astriarenae]QIA65583.1 DUF1800 family protein [Vibrio astriarenae]